MTPADLPSVGPLIGQQVRVTVVFDIRGYRTDPEVHEGRLIAIGRKQGPDRRHTMPYCLVLDASNGTGGVPIIAIRSVKSVEPITAEQRHGAQPGTDAAATDPGTVTP